MEKRESEINEVELTFRSNFANKHNYDNFLSLKTLNCFLSDRDKNMQNIFHCQNNSFFQFHRFKYNSMTYFLPVLDSTV